MVVQIAPVFRVTVYEVMASPPVVKGATQVTTAEVSLADVVTDLGVPGTVATRYSAGSLVSCTVIEPST